MDDLEEKWIVESLIGSKFRPCWTFLSKEDAITYAEEIIARNYTNETRVVHSKPTVVWTKVRD